MRDNLTGYKRYNRPPQRENREKCEEGGNKNKVKFVSGTYVVIGGLEMDRCEAVARDEVIF